MPGISALTRKDTKQILNEILSENCGKELKKIAKDTDRDHWMRADEAVAYGVVDMVLSNS